MVPVQRSSGRRLDGAIAVITGAGSGIGRASMLLFGRQGGTVVGIDRDSVANADLEAELCAEGLSSHVYTADVTDKTALRSVVSSIASRYGRVDVLFNNAGAHAAAPLASTSEELWDEMIAVNLTSAHRWTIALLPLLRASTCASVIHHASLDALFGNPSLAAYSVAKGGLIPLTHIGAHELGRAGIRVNCIASGGIATAMMLPDMRAKIRAVTPLGREGTPEEVAHVALFLASRESSFVNGSVIIVDGGRTAPTVGTTG